MAVLTAPKCYLLTLLPAVGLDSACEEPSGMDLARERSRGGGKGLWHAWSKQYKTCPSV